MCTIASNASWACWGGDVGIAIRHDRIGTPSVSRANSRLRHSEPCSRLHVTARTPRTIMIHDQSDSYFDIEYQSTPRIQSLTSLQTPTSLQRSSTSYNILCPEKEPLFPQSCCSLWQPCRTFLLKHLPQQLGFCLILPAKCYPHSRSCFASTTLTQIQGL